MDQEGLGGIRTTCVGQGEKKQRDAVIALPRYKLPRKHQRKNIKKQKIIAPTLMQCGSSTLMPVVCRWVHAAGIKVSGNQVDTAASDWNLT